MSHAPLDPAHQLVAALQRIYRSGLTTTSGGNLSLREPGGAVWITPSGVDKGALGPGDVVRVTPDGRCEGRHRPSVELPFHQLVYARRPDLGAVVHAHPPALIAFSMARRIPDPGLVPGLAPACGPAALAPYALPGSAALGEAIAAVFARGVDAVMLENHGAVVGGPDLARAFATFEALDLAACIELQARRLGAPRRPAAAAAGDGPWPEAAPAAPVGEAEDAARRELAALVRRACAQGLFTGSQGTFSRRLPGGALLLTPRGLDLAALGPADLVRLEPGWEALLPRAGRLLALHLALHARHPELGAVVTARPPHLMAFAVTGVPLDTRTIPESYIVLRDVVRLPFEAAADPERVAAALGGSVPVALLEHEALLATGGTPLQAFDRLEVAEFSARALIACRAVGEVVTIADREIEAIARAFPLGSSGARPAGEPPTR